jgi:hypothetical protein
MAPRNGIKRTLRALRQWAGMVKREVLRDPDVLLFEQKGDVAYRPNGLRQN